METRLIKRPALYREFLAAMQVYSSILVERRFHIMIAGSFKWLHLPSLRKHQMPDELNLTVIRATSSKRKGFSLLRRSQSVLLQYIVSVLAYFFLSLP